ncbi:MAG: MmcQ/YjbR family DNA-binding protein [Gemmatimonadota bacterium]
MSPYSRPNDEPGNAVENSEEPAVMNAERYSAQEVAWLERFRNICLAIPGATEALKWGHPNFLIGKKIFASFGREVGVISVAFKCPEPKQAALLASGRYIAAPYVGRYGWVCFPLRGRIPWGELAEGVAESCKLVAAKPRRAPA